MTHDEQAHHVPYGTYVKIWLTLVILTGITVGAAYTNLKHLAIFTAILIATVKSSLVTLYFMHVRYEKRIFAYMIIAVLVTYAIFLGLTFSDYSFRVE
jgi:cytochrome c oxidase subunit 4